MPLQRELQWKKNLGKKKVWVNGDSVFIRLKLHLKSKERKATPCVNRVEENYYLELKEVQKKYLPETKFQTLGNYCILPFT